MLRWYQGSVSLASLPPAVSWPGASFPPRGPEGRFPRLTGTIRRSESPPPVPPHFVSFAWRYPGRIRVSIPWPPDAPSTGLELVTRYLPPGICREDGGASQVPGGPPRSCPALRPRRDRTRQAIAAPRRGLPSLSRRRLPRFDAFGAQSHGPLTRCLRFAARVAPAPRKTRFRPLAKLCRTGLVTRKVPTKGFRCRFPVG